MLKIYSESWISYISLKFPVMSAEYAVKCDNPNACAAFSKDCDVNWTALFPLIDAIVALPFVCIEFKIGALFVGSRNCTLDKVIHMFFPIILELNGDLYGDTKKNVI